MSQLELPPSRFARTMAQLKRPEVLWRIAICAAVATVMWLVTGGWRPAFPFRTSQTPARNIVTRTTFDTPDPLKTKQLQDKTRAEFHAVYDNDTKQLRDLRRMFRQRLLSIVQAPSFEQVDKSLLQEFAPAHSTSVDESKPDGAEDSAESSRDTSTESLRQVFEKLKASLADDPGLDKLEVSLESAFQDMDRDGVLEVVQHREGNQNEIQVHSLLDGKVRPYIDLSKVKFDAAMADLRGQLMDKLTQPMAFMADSWFSSRISATLTHNERMTNQLLDQELAGLDEAVVVFEAGVDTLALGGQALDSEHIDLLSKEHHQFTITMPIVQRLARVAASFAMYLALYLLSGAYIYYRDPQVIRDFKKFVRLQTILLLCVVLAKVCAHDSWQAELIPLMLFGMTVAIAYRQEIALLIAVGVCLTVVISLGQGLTELVILTATLATTIILLRDVRSRTKLIYVGIAAGAVAFLTAMSVGILREPTFGLPLVVTAAKYGLFSVIAGVLMTGILPFVESAMELQTDISLLELGDVAHPLLQELVRRAPGTYNHSITVAAVAEAAAESIGANGLLVRVGAYFHDIGKMLKPQYFIENQGQDANRHEDLLPAMSTLIIIAHVKDGADLARQHHLPHPVIDFILQHHGTTLVEYFYNRASRQSAEDPDASEVDETSYRYPGPKPQTREAAVLMLADAAESASRTLQEPAPSRIESLVHEIASKRLLDGQFDECGLTFKELHTIENSIVKSLTAMYHGRVKYPEQQTA